MTCRSGEDSPAAEGSDADTDVDASPQEVAATLKSTVASVRPRLKDKAVVSFTCVEDVLMPAVDADPVVEPVQDSDFVSDMFARMAAREGAAAEDGEYDDDGAVIFSDGAGEARELRLPPDVPVPSAETVRKHRASGHCPYRAWCAHCVSGAANAPAHKARCAEPLGDVPEVHSDYGFFRDRKGDKAHAVTVLVSKDRKSGATCAHVVPRKGVGGGYAVKQFLRDIKKYGHRHKVLLRTDGEPAIRDLMEKVSQLRASETNVAETIIESTPKGDSKANGRAERAVQSIEKQVRVLKLAVEEHLGTFSVTHKAFPWLVEHAADALTKFRVNPDGATAYEQIKGRAYSGLMFEFGQCILFKTSAKVEGGNMQARWQKGMWLGKRFATEEHIISNPDGCVFRSGAVRPHPDHEYDSHLFDALKGLPWDPPGKNLVADPENVQEHLRDLPRVVVPRPEASAIPRARAVMITKEYIEKFGPTEGCAKCRAVLTGSTASPGMGHSSGCQVRMEGLLADDPVLSRRLVRARGRQDEFLARRVEAGDESAVKRPRSEEEKVELQSGPGGASEESRPEPEPSMDGESVYSRCPSTVTCATDVAREPEDDDVDIPIPLTDDPPTAGASSSSGIKRDRDGSDGDEAQGDQVPDPDDPEDMAYIDVPEVLMLGERRRAAGALGSDLP